MKLSFRNILPLTVGTAVLTLITTGTMAQTPFYKGKRITMLINFAVGGGADIEGRLFAKYLAKYLEGQPIIVAQNMEGAGGLVGANFLGEVAPKDGTYIGYLSSAAGLHLSEPERWRCSGCQASGEGRFPVFEMASQTNPFGRWAGTRQCSSPSSAVCRGGIQREHPHFQWTFIQCLAK